MSPGSRTPCSWQPPFHFPPERPADLVGHFRPAHSHIMQFAIAHAGELTPHAATLAPRPHQNEDRSRDCKRGILQRPPALPAAFHTNAAQCLSPPPACALAETAPAPARPARSRNTP